MKHSLSPLGNLLVRLVHGGRRAASDIRPLPELSTRIFVLVDLDAAIDIMSRAKRHQSLGFHVAEITIWADEVGPPRGFGAAQLRCRLAGVSGHDQLLGHPSGTRAGVDAALW